jgi:DNA replication protein DnaC
MARRRKRAGGASDDALAEAIALAQELDLTALATQLPDLLARAQQTEPSFTDFVLSLLRAEAATRDERRRTRNRRRARLPERIEGLEGFDFSIRPQLEPRVVRELLHCRWVVEGRNVHLIGRPGTGKTRTLDALADAALNEGYTVLKVTAADLLEDLRGAAELGTYKRVLRRYVKPDVLCLEEFGYATFGVDASGHLFRLVAARYETRASIVLAANTGFTNWRRFFPSEAQSVATVDRLIDRATILRFSGPACRKPKEIVGADPDAPDKPEPPDGEG